VRRGFAHRGGGHGPDNTLGTFAAALIKGVRGLETDAWLTQDGAVVLDHDGLAGPGRQQPIAQVRRDELPAHIPTLDELYETCGTDFELAVDVKNGAIAAAVTAVAERHHVADRLWIFAAHAAQLDGLPGVHRGVTIRGNIIRSAQRRGVLAQARSAGVEAVNARWMWWSRRLVDDVHRAGMLAFGYDAQRRASLRRSLRIGLDGVFSDQVDLMVAALAAADD
jgi:glycerophosphoryl diester phosphodiesterase